MHLVRIMHSMFVTFVTSASVGIHAVNATGYISIYSLYIPLKSYSYICNKYNKGYFFSNYVVNTLPPKMF